MAAGRLSRPFSRICQVSRRICHSSYYSANSNYNSTFKVEEKRNFVTIGDKNCQNGSSSKADVVVELERGAEKFPHKCVANTSETDYEIPEPEDMDLYEYIKKLEKTTARGRGVILKTWSRITRQPKNVNISGGFKSRSVQFLGLTTRLLEERLTYLAQIGIRGRDALIIALEFPAILSWDCPNFRRMLELLNDLECDIVRLLCKTPYVFGLDYTRATENLHKLTACGVSKEVISKLVTHHPILLSFPLRSDCIEVIQLLMNAHEKLPPERNEEGTVSMREAVLNLLLQPLEKSKEQVNLQDNFKQVVSFLQEMQVSPLVIAAKNPTIFVTKLDTLTSALEFFSSKPLLFEMELIQELLTLRSEIFVDFDATVMKNRIQLIYDIVQSPTVLYNLLQSSFIFEKSDTKIEEIIQWLRDHSIDDKKIGYLLTLKNFFSLEKRDLIEKADYLLTVKGVKMEDIQENPACLLKPMSHLKERVEFLNTENLAGLENSDLGKLMMTKNKEFAVEVCGSSLEKFTQFLESQSKI